MTHYRLCGYGAASRKTGERQATGERVLADALRELYDDGARNVDVYAGGRFLGTTTPRQLHADRVELDPGTGSAAHVPDVEVIRIPTADENAFV